MTGAHRQCRRPSLFSDLAADHPGRVIVAVLAVLVAVADVSVMAAFTIGGGSPGTPQQAAAVTAPLRPVTPASQQGYFAALYTDALIGPRDLSSDDALRLGESLCGDLRSGAQLATLVAYLRRTTTLAPMQAARLVDAADRDLCPK